MFLAVPSIPPELVSAIALDSRSIRISWIPPNMENVNGIVRQYIINVTEVTTGQDILLQTNQTDITVDGLHPHYEYSYQVAAETVAVGPWSLPSIIHMPEDGE